jgi:hypothetical protein
MASNGIQLVIEYNSFASRNGQRGFRRSITQSVFHCYVDRQTETGVYAEGQVRQVTKGAQVLEGED